MLSIIIPVYHEQTYLPRTLKALTSQKYIHGCEIILAEYNPGKLSYTTKVAKEFYDKYHINIIIEEVHKPGIAYARNVGVLASQGDYFLNFDADARFNRTDSLEKMVTPLMAETAMLTVCDNEFDYRELSKADLKDMTIPQGILDGLNNSQTLGFPILEPGSCFNKEAFLEVGGFNDISKWELSILGPRFIFRFPRKIKHVPGVSVIVSPRRALKLSELGLGTLNYNNAIRGSNVETV